MRAKPAAGPWIGVAFGVAAGAGGRCPRHCRVRFQRHRDGVAFDSALVIPVVLDGLCRRGNARRCSGRRSPRWQRRGREFGLAFAAAHLVHLGLVVWLYRVSGHVPLSGSMFVFVFFTIGIVWTYLLAALSFGGLSRALGPRPWRLLRFLGMNYILLAFARDFVPPVIHSGIVHQEFWQSVSYAPFAAMSVAAPLLCLAAAGHRRWGMRHATA